MPKRIRFLTILKWIRLVMSLMPLPSWTDVEAVRLWVLKTLGMLDELADETETQIDDQIVDALKTIVNDAETFTAFYTLLLDLISERDSGAVSNREDPRARAIADKAGIDFSIFKKLLEYIMEFIEWWKNSVFA